MAVDKEIVAQHLARLARAYGPDLTLPRRAAGSPAALPPAAGDRTAAAAPPAPAAGDAAPASPPPPAAPLPPPPPAAGQPTLDELRAAVLACTRCKLHEGRRRAVFGEGNPRAEVMFIGEAPGAVEDQTGRPFVGPAGQLLDRILTGAMGLQRADVYIANINKCRPPGNRPPEADEVAACLPYLTAQVALIRPRVIVCLGRTAAHNLLGRDEPMRALRGRDLSYQGIPVVVTWHPAYLLREPERKRETWEDIKRVNRLLGRPEVPPPPAP
jgi:DNA polymerase